MSGKGLLTGHGQSRAKQLMGASMTRTYLNGLVTAKRVVISFNEIESKTDIHPLNPRNQEALTLDAVRDIYQSIKDNGVNQEGVAIKCPSSGKYLFLDASRRRFTCIHAESDLPFWELQGNVTDDQILAIINDSQEVKRWSYPEHAAYLFKVAERKGIDIESTKIEDLAVALSIGRESLRKRIVAYNVALELRTVFVDYEGIPNAYYATLAKFQRELVRSKKDIAKEMKEFMVELNRNELTGDVSDIQKETLELLTLFIGKILSKTAKREWVTSPLAEFTDKKAYARVSRSPDRNSVKFELSRVDADLTHKIEGYIKRVLAGEAE